MMAAGNEKFRFASPTVFTSGEELRRVFGADGPAIDPGGSVLFRGGVTVMSGVRFRGSCVIGDDVVIDTGAVLEDAEIGDACRIRPYSLITGCRLGRGNIAGPFCFLRDRTTVGDDCIVGTHVEIARSRLGDGVKVSHQAFIGDADVGDGVIVGAGVVFCNYEKGERLHSTVGERAVIGSGTMVVAPARIGCDALIGAGSVITRPVPDRARVIQRRSPT
jgi:bifunctional UDP-N-acetylglucosamine pyrophosphorylase/glucosamine-1-phosphate N-acetyltransferase